VAGFVLVDQLRQGDAKTHASARVVGGAQVVFDSGSSACSPEDTPDAPPRAFRDAAGQVHLIASSYVTRAMLGPTLDQVRHSCQVVMQSDYDSRPYKFNDREWVTAPYTRDGRTVFALVHEEYQGDKHPGRCPSGIYLKCWYNSITFAVSRDGGATFSQRSPPRDLVPSVP